MDKALAEAIERAGGLSALARQLRITPQSIFKWKKVPPTRVLEVERITKVSRHKLRPDLYPAKEPKTKSIPIRV